MTTTRIQNVNVISFFLAVQWPKIRLSWWRLSLNAVLGISNYWTQDVQHVWNPERDRNGQQGHVCEGKFPFENLSEFNLSWPDIGLSSGKFEKECHPQILRPKWPSKHVAHRNCVTLSFGDLFDMTLTFTWSRPLLKWYFLHPLRSNFGKVGNYSCYESHLGNR